MLENDILIMVLVTALAGLLCILYQLYRLGEEKSKRLQHGLQIDLMHENIKAGKLSAIEKVVKENPKERHFYNNEDTSVAATAIKEKQIAIYKFLVSKRVHPGLGEDMEELVKGFSDAEKKEIQEIHLNYSVESDLKHLKTLYGKTKLNHDVEREGERKLFKKIEGAYEELNEIKEIEAILKVVACADVLNVIFDFNRESVVHIDPGLDRNTKGICYYHKGRVFIGAKGLLDDEESRLKALGVMAHEFCHYAMKLIYDNRCNPYCWGDDEQEKRFSAILGLCEGKKDGEDQIRFVFFYPKNQRSAELIVRVPYLLALHKNSEINLTKA